MAFRELFMVEVKEILRRWQSREGMRKAAAATGCDRKTVRRYYEAAAHLVLPRDGVLTDDQVHAVAQIVQAKPVVVPGDDYPRLFAHKTTIVSWLQATPPLSLQKIHRKLKEQNTEVPYHTLRRFARAELQWKKRRSTVRLDDPAPGQEAQLDFGYMGTILDPATGLSRRLWVLIITLVHSRYMFVYPTFLQSTAAVCEALEAAWRFFGGMPHILIPDNAKAMIELADKHAPRMTESFADYVQSRGLFVDAARVRRPKDKARVERQVPYVRGNGYAGERFESLEQARQSAATWCREIAGQRVHGSTRKVPCEVYQTVEKPHMKPAPTDAFDVPAWLPVKVHDDPHVTVLQALYSVPAALKGKPLRARADRTSVRLYEGTKLIAMHSREAAGGRSTLPEHYPEGKEAYAKRSVAAVLERLQKKGGHIAEYGKRLLDGPLPWTRMRQAYSLLSLCDTYGSGRVEAVCQSALSFDVVDVVRLRRVLQSSLTPPIASGAKGKVVALPTPRFARDEAHFATRKPSKEEK